MTHITQSGNSHVRVLFLISILDFDITVRTYLPKPQKFNLGDVEFKLNFQSMTN